MSTTVIPGYLRRQVMELHGSKCLSCGVQTTPEWWGPEALHIDHVIAEFNGGTTTLDNLQPLCRTCNLSKGATDIDYRNTVSTTELNGSGVRADIRAEGVKAAPLRLGVKAAPLQLSRNTGIRAAPLQLSRNTGIRAAKSSLKRKD